MYFIFVNKCAKKCNRFESETKAVNMITLHAEVDCVRCGSIEAIDARQEY